MKEGSPEPFSLHCPKLTFVTTFWGDCLQSCPQNAGGSYCTCLRSKVQNQADAVLHEGFRQNAQHPRGNVLKCIPSRVLYKCGESFEGAWGNFFKSSPIKNPCPTLTFVSVWRCGDAFSKAPPRKNSFESFPHKKNSFKRTCKICVFLAFLRTCQAFSR